MTTGAFWELVINVCMAHSGSITSAHRTPKRNKAVGGADNSQHLGTKAVDIVWDDPAVRVEAEELLMGQGLWIEPTRDAPDHTHVDDRHNAWQKE